MASYRAEQLSNLSRLASASGGIPELQGLAAEAGSTGPVIHLYANGDLETVHYSPMEKQGAIVLGSGGDGSTWSAGSFFEGAMTIGCPDDNSVDDAIQANIVAAGYGR